MGEDEQHSPTGYGLPPPRRGGRKGAAGARSLFGRARRTLCIGGL